SHFECASVDCFHKALPSLFKFQHCHEQNTRKQFAKTSIGQIVFEALDYALETGRTALVEGNSGIGKSTALKAWCAMHLGRARYVQLKGITNRTSFFKELARACGIPRGTALSASKVQMRVEDFLQRSKLMLIIDEAQYLLPPGNRASTPPELINWLN